MMLEREAAGVQAVFLEPAAAPRWETWTGACNCSRETLSGISLQAEVEASRAAVSMVAVKYRLWRAACCWRWPDAGRSTTSRDDLWKTEMDVSVLVEVVCDGPAGATAGDRPLQNGLCLLHRMDVFRAPEYTVRGAHQTHRECVSWPQGKRKVDEVVHRDSLSVGNSGKKLTARIWLEGYSLLYRQASGPARPGSQPARWLPSAHEVDPEPARPAGDRPEYIRRLDGTGRSTGRIAGSPGWLDRGD